jgi:anti-anti-sigma regulatory factor
MALPRRVRRDLAATRVLDALEAREGDTLAALGADARAMRDQLTCSSYVLDDCALTFLGGKVTRAELDALGVIECLEQTARDRDCILDLRNVTLLESSAVVALQPFFASREFGEGRMVFSGISPAVAQMFQMAGLGQPENCVDDAMLLSVICEGGFGNG